MRTALCLFSLLSACSPAASDDTAAAGDSAAADARPPEPEACGEVLLEVMGDDPPRVGDEWTVWLRCDGATLAGVAIVRVTPPEMARIDDNIVTWVGSGEASLFAQYGAERGERAVTVAP